MTNKYFFLLLLGALYPKVLLQRLSRGCPIWSEGYGVRGIYNQYLIRIAEREVTADALEICYNHREICL